MRLGDGGFGIERKIRIDFRRDAAGNEAGQRSADRNGETVCHGGNNGVGLAALLLAPGDGFLHSVGERRRAECLQNDCRVGGAIHRLQARNRLDIAGVGNDCGDGAKLFEFGCHI